MPLFIERLRSLITLAIAKGRILQEALGLLAQKGISPEVDPAESRKLILQTSKSNLQILVVRSSDVATYVHHGVADLGIVGKDSLLEYQGGRVYEMRDLGIAQCRMIVAAKESESGALSLSGEGKLFKVATKYPVIAEQYFSEKGIQVEVIKLYGSMELAPLLGLADCIVDIVDTGNTLKANGLIELHHIVNISTRLIASKAATKVKAQEINQIIDFFGGV